MWVKSAKGKSLFISRFSLHRTLNLENLHKQNFRSATLGGGRVWSAGLSAGILDRAESSTNAVTGILELPVEQQTKFEFIVNLKAAKQIGPDYPAERAGAGESSNQVVTRRC